MGVIQRQGFKGTIIGMIGIAVGAFSTLYIYPKSLELLGLFRTLFDTSVLLGIPVLMGGPTAAVRFFPKYKDPATGHRGFLTWLLLVFTLGMLLFIVLFPWIKSGLASLIFHERNILYEDSIYYLLPLTFFAAWLNILSRYISNFKRITVPAIFEQLTIKFALPAAIFAFLQGWVDVTGFWVIILGSYLIASISLAAYLAYLGEFKLTHPQIVKDKTALKEYAGYSGYGLLAGIGGQVAFRIDTLMVASLIELKATGIYAIAATLSEVIIKPMRSLTAIAGPVISQHLEANNIDEVRRIYQKSSLNMTIIGVGTFMLIWTILPYVFNMMANADEIRAGAYVVFFLGLAQVWDMMTGVNNEIISYSKYYRMALYLIILLAVMNILANLFLIPVYGMTGAAMATCIAMFIFNVVKLIFIKIKLGILPFNPRVLPAIAFAVASFFICRWIPDTKENLINLLLNSILFVAIYGVSIWKFAISTDINQAIESGLIRVKNWIL